MKTQSEIWKFT